MLVRGLWNPLFAAPDDQGAGGTDDAAGGQDDQVKDGAEDQGAEPPKSKHEMADGPGSGRSKLRQQLEANTEGARKAQEKRDKKAAPKAPRRVAGGAEIVEDGAEPADGADGADAVVEGKQQQQQDTTPAPEALSKEAKAEWDKTPPAVKAAFIKREKDVAQGVEALKTRYADIDKALEPHMPAIRQHGHTPAAAVNQLFNWFQALAANPDVAFPALMQSFKWAPKAGGQQQQQQQPKVGADGKPIVDQPNGELPPAVQEFINQQNKRIEQLEGFMTQKIGGLENTFVQQSQAKTNEILERWSDGKEHFQEVRGLMAHLIGSGAVPLKNGQVDLDSAYQMAVYAHPEIRPKVIAAEQAAAQKAAKEKREAELKAQNEQAQKARKKDVSITGGAPGNPGAPAAPKKGKGKSVRESLMEARQELASDA